MTLVSSEVQRGINETSFQADGREGGMGGGGVSNLW